MPENKNGLPDPNKPAPPAPEGVKPPVPPVQPEGGVKPPEGKPGTGTPQVTPPTEGMVPHGALHEEREKRKESDAKLEQIKLLYGDKIRFDHMGNVVAPEPVTPATNVQSPSDIQKRVEELWESDPKQAVRMEIGMAINWLDQQTAQVDIQRDNARSKYTDFSKWESEISSYLRRLPLQQRTQPGIIDLAYRYVKGDKIDDILKEQQAELARKYASGEAVQGLGPGTATGVPIPPGTGPTADQITAANAMGMSIEDYMKNLAPVRGK